MCELDILAVPEVWNLEGDSGPEMEGTTAGIGIPCPRFSQHFNPGAGIIPCQTQCRHRFSSGISGKFKEGDSIRSPPGVDHRVWNLGHRLSASVPHRSQKLHDCPILCLPLVVGAPMPREVKGQEE